MDAAHLFQTTIDATQPTRVTRRETILTAPSMASGYTEETDAQGSLARYNDLGVRQEPSHEYVHAAAKPLSVGQNRPPKRRTRRFRQRMRRAFVTAWKRVTQLFHKPPLRIHGEALDDFVLVDWEEGSSEPSDRPPS